MGEKAVEKSHLHSILFLITISQWSISDVESETCAL